MQRLSANHISSSELFSLPTFTRVKKESSISLYFTSQAFLQTEISLPYTTTKYHLVSITKLPEPLVIVVKNHEKGGKSLSRRIEKSAAGGSPAVCTYRAQRDRKLAPFRESGGVCIPPLSELRDRKERKRVDIYIYIQLQQQLS